MHDNLRRLEIQLRSDGVRSVHIGVIEHSFGFQLGEILIAFSNIKYDGLLPDYEDTLIAMSKLPPEVNIETSLTSWRYGRIAGFRISVFGVALFIPAKNKYRERQVEDISIIFNHRRNRKNNSGGGRSFRVNTQSFFQGVEK